MPEIRGITITLYEKRQTGTDGFNKPVYAEQPVQVGNVLIAPVSGDDVASILDLTGKKAVYTLAIPKGDTHIWEDRRIKFFGQTWHSFGFSTVGIEENIPLSWNRKVMVERYG